MRIKRLLTLCATIQCATGLFLLVRPALLARLLLGGELAGTGIALSRIAAVALLSLAVACWPALARSANHAPAVRALLLYHPLVAIYLAYVGVRYTGGPLLWPAAAIHALLTVLLITAGLKPQRY